MTNDFLPVADGGGANVSSQADFVASAVRPLGFGLNAVPGSALWNKMMRQSSVIASQFAQMICDYSGANMLDDGNLATLLATMKTQFRTRLLVNTTFYVSPTGNDGTGDGTVGAPWLTIAHAHSVIQNNYDTTGIVATIQLADGSYAGAALSGPIAGNTLGPVGIVINGNSVTPTNVILTGNVSVNNGGFLTVQNVKSSGTIAFQSSNGSFIVLKNIYTTGTANYPFYASGGTISFEGNINIAGNNTYCFLGLGDGSFFNFSSGITITYTGTPVYSSATFNITELADVHFSGALTFAGSATGSQFIVTTNSVIARAGNSLPGSTAGSTSTGGVVA